MNEDGWTPKIYEDELVSFDRRLRIWLETGEGDGKKLMKEAQELLEMQERFPEVFERHAHIEGLVADLIARRDQEEIFSGMGGSATRGAEPPGCLFGWFMKGKGRS